jgi:preprotein translocase subunit Sss1
MTTLQEKILEKFLTKLAEKEGADEEKIKQLRTLLAASKKPKADELVRIFTLPAGGDIK